MKGFLTKGKVVIAGLGGDEAILRAMLSNEEDTVTACDRAVKFQDAPDSVLDILERGDQDENRHADWIRSALKEVTADLQRCGVPLPRPAERRGAQPALRRSCV